MTARLLLLSLFLFSTQLFAQNSFEDSLLGVIRKSSPVSKTAQYIKLADFFSARDQFGKSIAYGDKSLQNSLKTKDKKGRLKALISIGASHYLNSDYVRAEHYFKQALELATLLHDENSRADISMNLGAIMQLNSKYSEAFELYLDARHIFEKNKNYDELLACYHNIASVLAILGQEDKVKAYYLKIREVLPRVQSAVNQIKGYSILASYYNDYGQTAAENELAITYAERGIELSRKTAETGKLAYLFNCLARAHEIKGDFRQSVKNYKEALKYLNSSNLQVDYYSYVGLYYSYIELKDIKNARIYLDSIRNHHFTRTIDLYRMEYLQMLYEYNKEHKLSEALKNLEEINALKEKIQSKENVKVVNELERKYNQTKNYTSILKLRSQKKLLVEKNKIKSLQVQVLVFGLLFLLLVIFVAVYIYRQSIRNKQLKILEIEQNLNRVRMNPHFIFNVLSSLQTLALDPLRSHLMPEYLARFSRIMRQSLESSFSELVTLEEELEFLTNYLEIQQLVKGEKFTFGIQLSEQIDTFDRMVPVMIFQPFIENALEHGFASMASGGKIGIRFEDENGGLHVNISDNGQWQTAAGKAYPSRALQIINDRFFLLKKRYKKQAEFRVSRNEEGVSVDIHLPKLS